MSQQKVDQRKLDKLDSKIKALLEERHSLIEKKAQDLAQTILKAELGFVDEEILLGALLELKQEISSPDSDKIEKWRTVGREFFRKERATKKQRKQSNKSKNQQTLADHQQKLKSVSA
ncbi:MAG: conjugal transfer protein TraD [Pseudomonadota bacterium]